MSNVNFTTTFTVDQTPDEAFAAIIDVRRWWSGQIDGDTDTLGAEFTYRYEDIHRSTQKIIELIPGKRIAWHVLDSYLNFTHDRTEWTGTNITFDISTKDGKTEVRFTHAGLVPEFECYDDCASAWGYYINTSLHDLITTGYGQPNQTEHTANATK